MCLVHISDQILSNVLGQFTPNEDLAQDTRK